MTAILHHWVLWLASTGACVDDPANIYISSCMAIGIILGCCATVVGTVAGAFVPDGHGWALTLGGLLLVPALPIALMLAPLLLVGFVLYKLGSFIFNKWLDAGHERWVDSLRRKNPNYTNPKCYR